MRRSPDLAVVAVTLILSLTSCIDVIPSRVQLANRAIVSFLIKYTNVQANNWKTSKEYDAQCVPGRQSLSWAVVSRDYASVLSRGYACRFNVNQARFSVSCFPQSASTLRLSYYADEARRITLSGNGPAGPNSPELRLEKDQERDLRGADR